MCQLIHKSLSELQAMTKAQLIQMALEGITDTTLMSQELWPDGQIKLRIWVARYRFDNSFAWKHKHTWSYYPTGEVDVFIESHFNAGDSEIGRRKIKHFLDGRQPIIIEDTIPRQ